MSDQPPAPSSFEVVLLDELLAFVQPLMQAAESEAVLADMLAVLGWNSTEIGFATDALSGIDQAVEAIQDIVDDLSQPDAEITLGTLVDSLVATEGLVQAVIAIEHALNPPPPGFDAFGAQLLEYLTTTWLRTRHATIYEAMTLLTLVTPASKQLPAADAVLSASGEIVSFPNAQDQLAFDQLGKLLTDPVGTLKAAYVPTGVTGQAFADALADSVLPPAGRLLQQFGAQASYGANAVGGVDLGANAGRAAHILAFWFAFGDDGAGASVMLRPTPGQATGTDIGVAPFGRLVFKDTVGSWMFELDVGGTLHPVFFGPHGVAFDPPGGKLTAGARLTKLSAGSGPVVLIGSDNATRLEIGALSLELDGSLDTSGDWDLGFLTRAQHALVAVAGGDGDGFLAKVLPAPGLQIPFDLGVGWSRAKGLYFEGGVTIKVDLPLHLSLFDVLKIEEIELAVTPIFATPAGVTIDAGVTAGLTIGPFSAEVEKIGLRTTMTFPQGGGGNVGPVQFQLGFKPPTGAGLSLDAGVVGGGGFLSFDDPEYAGILELEALDTIALKVIGLISTRMPSGQQGLLAAADHHRRVPADPARLRLHAQRRRRHHRRQPHDGDRRPADRPPHRRARVDPVPARPGRPRPGGHLQPARGVPGRRGPVRPRADGQARLGLAVADHARARVHRRAADAAADRAARAPGDRAARSRTTPSCCCSSTSSGCSTSGPATSRSTRRCTTRGSPSSRSPATWRCGRTSARTRRSRCRPAASTRRSRRRRTSRRWSASGSASATATTRGCGSRRTSR